MKHLSIFNFHLSILAAALLLLSACEKKNEEIPGDGVNNTSVQFVNLSGLDATCLIELNDSNASVNVLLNAEPFSESSWVDLYDELRCPMNPIRTQVTVLVWDTMPLNQRKIMENFKYDFHYNQAYQITLDRQAKFFFIGQKNN